MNQSKYFGSVRFFKHLILLCILLLILIPTVLAVVWRSSLSSAREELSALHQPTTRQLTASAVIEKTSPAGELSAPEILCGESLILHGLGEKDGVATLNSLECFLDNYARGVRVFEVDLRLTSDGHVVLRHDWRVGLQENVDETNVPTLEEFFALPVCGKYTPLSFSDLLLLLEQYDDVCVITDTKFVDEEIVTFQFSAMLRDARELGLSYLFDRVIVQVYSPKMFKVTDALHHFPHYIYTLYQSGFSCTEDDFREKADFCRENGIMGITMWDYWWDDAYAHIAGEYGLTVYLHTVNDAQQAASFLSRGVSGVYTDVILPADLPAF